MALFPGVTEDYFLKIIIKKHRLIPDHQFADKRKRATIEQIHRIITRINNNMKVDTIG